MPPALPWILVTPASQGIGLALTRHLLRTTRLPVVATARNDVAGARARMAEGLDVDDERLDVLELEVTDEPSIAAAASRCRARFAGSYLQLAFCVPGVLHPERSPQQIDAGRALATFQVNALGPLLLMKHFAAFLPRKATPVVTPAEGGDGLPARAVFAAMSARVGSIADNRAGGWYSYRSSKAAVNQMVRSLDIYLRATAGEKAMAVALHPGTVKTGLSKDFWASTPREKLFSAEYSAERLVDVVKGLKDGDRGKCWDWKGEEIPP